MSNFEWWHRSKKRDGQGAAALGKYAARVRRHASWALASAILLAGLSFPSPLCADGVVPREVEDFSFTDRTGKTITREDLLGKPWIAGFIFTRCAGPCPKVTGRMKQLRESTGIQCVTFDVDPAFDTEEVLARYSELYSGLKPGEEDKWYFLTGDQRQIYHLIHDSFQMPVQELEGEDRQPGFEVIHSTNIVLVNSNGQFIAKYNATVDSEMATLRRVIEGKEEPRIPPSSDAAPSSLDKPPKDIIIAPARESGLQQRSTPEWVSSLPAVNASLNGLATILLISGYILIKSRKPAAHKRVMLSAFVTSILFLGCYLVYHAYAGSKRFPGTGPVKLVYLTILVTHIVLAATVPVLASITIYRGLAAKWDAHRRIARITFPIWVYVSVTGVIIYLMLYHWPVSS